MNSLNARRIAVFLGLLLVLSSAGFAQKSDSPEEPLPQGKPGDWIVELSNSGGFAYRHSFLFITSDGHFRRQKPFQKDVEEGTAPAAVFEKLNQAVLAAKSSSWKQNYDRPGDTGCCDRIATALRLDVCGTDGKWIRYQGRWHSPVDQPAELRAILTALNF